jgi:hypothetical protein
LNDWKSFDLHLTVKASTPTDLAQAYGRISTFLNSYMLESSGRQGPTMPGGLIYWYPDTSGVLERGEMPTRPKPEPESWQPVVRRLPEGQARSVLAGLLDFSRDAMLRPLEALDGRSRFIFTEREARHLIPALWGEHNAHKGIQNYAASLIKPLDGR